MRCAKQPAQAANPLGQREDSGAVGRLPGPGMLIGADKRDLVFG